MKILRWLRKYWWVPLFFLASILLWVVLRKKGTPIKQTQAELEAIEAQRRVRELEEQRGLEEAKKHIANEYAKEINDLDKKQQAKAKELRDDPAKLAKFLVRAGRR